MLSLIYARSLNHCIGADGEIPWRLPDDFAHFKQTTMGKPIIMGRKTYEDHNSVLPGRLNIVVTRNSDYQAANGIRVVQSLEDAIELAYRDNDEIFVIGGVAFFEQSFARADTVYETVVETQIDGDAILPSFDFSDWQTTLMSHHAKDERHQFPFSIFRHDRDH